MGPKALYTFMLAVFCGLNFGCQERKTLNFKPETAKSTLSKENTLAAARILRDYYNLKDALVATDSKKAAIATKQMEISLNDFKNNLAAGHNDSSATESKARLNTLSGQLMTQLSNIQKANAPDCERMRIYFKPLSDAMYGLLKETGMKDIQAYHHYCPMAMNERGAYWLSASPDIENPYFGQKMLTCGELVDTIK